MMVLDIVFHCTEQRIPLDFDNDEKRLALDFENFQQIIYHEVERYDGEYEVIPKIEQQALLTNHKLMSDDVKILAIPYAEVSNDSNGKTVTIG